MCAWLVQANIHVSRTCIVHRIDVWNCYLFPFRFHLLPFEHRTHLYSMCSSKRCNGIVNEKAWQLIRAIWNRVYIHIKLLLVSKKPQRLNVVSSLFIPNQSNKITKQHKSNRTKTKKNFKHIDRVLLDTRKLFLRLTNFNEAINAICIEIGPPSHNCVIFNKNISIK